MKQLQPWLELSRLSNLPTVWSNTLLGAAAAAHLAENAAPAHCGWCIALTALAISAFYIAGMALNDVIDVSIDRRERPHRPIPAGRITRTAATVYACILMILGLAIIAALNLVATVPALLLVVLIVLYNLVHHRWSQSVMIMGGCRAMVYITVAATLIGSAAGNAIGDATASAWQSMFSVITHWMVLLPAALLWFYVVLLSVVARAEAGSPARVKLVMLMIAGISLLDALLLAVLWQHWLFALLAVSCFVMTRIGHRSIKGS